MDTAPLKGRTARRTASLAARAQLARLGRETLGALPPEPPGFGIGGAVGDAFFACALGRVDPAVETSRWISRAIDECNTSGADASLHQGMAGLGFLLATYTDMGDTLAAIDAALVDALPQISLVSLQGGIAGIALYASLRSNAPSGKQLQDAAVKALTVAATPSDGGVVWQTPSSYAHSRGVDVRGEPITEFGVVHGVSGVLVALAALAKQGRSDAAELARAGLHAAWSWERPGPNRFGRIEFGPHGAQGAVELPGAWCVGDAGVLRACWLAASATGDAISAEGALARLREDAARSVSGETPGVHGRFDLCCGSGAIAQVYLRMYLDTGLDEFRAANERILSTCAREAASIANLSFGYGRLGVILALLAASTDEEPVWDAVLGMSLPAAARRRRHRAGPR